MLSKYSSPDVRRIGLSCLLSQAPKFISAIVKVSSTCTDSHDQQLTLGDLAEIRKQSALEKTEEPKPEPKKRSVMVPKLTEGFGLMAAG
jgi:hypothetical protein